MDYEFLTEDRIRRRLFEQLLPPDSLVAEKWRGYGTRLHRNRVERTYFNREFDVAQFTRQVTQPIIGGPMYDLWLFGFEVKGYGKAKKKWFPPAYAEGIDQALVLLQQGADYASLVIPRPNEEEKLQQLFNLCETWCPLIGILISEEDGSFWNYRNAQRNYHSSPDRKKTLLLRLIGDGYLSDIRTPTWAKNHEF